MGDSFSAALRGVALMKRYQHPGDWWDGNTINDPVLGGMNVLPMEELRRGNGANISDIEARANAEAICAWARVVRLTPGQELRIIQDPNYDAYVAIPQEYWGVILPILEAL